MPIRTVERLDRLPAAILDWHRNAYIENESGTDQYRETQPESGAAHFAYLLTAGLLTRMERKAMTLAYTRWIGQATGSYAGSEDYAALLEWLWLASLREGSHPYYETIEEMLDVTIDCIPDDADDVDLQARAQAQVLLDSMGAIDG